MPEYIGFHDVFRCGLNIPNQLSKMRELKNENVYFDLRDSLKIYCAGKGIVTQIIQKNPYMRSGDACRLMNNLKRIYDESVPLHKLNRIVIHKTTHFTKEEMEGITNGLAGVDTLKLLVF